MVNEESLTKQQTLVPKARIKVVLNQETRHSQHSFGKRWEMTVSHFVEITI
jgi:hypothetical protein